MLARAQRELLGDDVLQAVYKPVPKLPQLGPEDPGPFAFASEERGTEAPRPFASRRLSPPRFQERSSCSIAFSRFLRARSMALASLGEILPEVISVSILS